MNTFFSSRIQKNNSMHSMHFRSFLIVCYIKLYVDELKSIFRIRFIDFIVLKIISTLIFHSICNFEYWFNSWYHQYCAILFRTFSTFVPYCSKRICSVFTQSQIHRNVIKQSWKMKYYWLNEFFRIILTSCEPNKSASTLQH